MVRASQSRRENIKPDRQKGRQTKVIKIATVLNKHLRLLLLFLLLALCIIHNIIKLENAAPAQTMIPILPSKKPFFKM